MLERNLMRLFEQFHHPAVKNKAALANEESWYGNPVNLYTAVTVTALLVWELIRK